MKRNPIVSALSSLFGSAVLLILFGAPSIADGRSADARPDTSQVAAVSVSTPLTSTFRYQGQLKNGGSPITDTCDFQFGLWDSLSDGTQLGITQTLSAPVNDGYFTALLNTGNPFGVNTFNGDMRWLAIAVRCPAGSGSYTAFNQRQQLTATPYSLFSAAPWVTSGSNLAYNVGNVGIGTTTPAHRLSVIGGPVWTSNGWLGALELSNGSAIGWQSNSSGQRSGIGHSNDGIAFFRTTSNPGTAVSPAIYDVLISNSGNVGIGTTNPTSKLEIAAQDGLAITGYQPFLTLRDTNAGNARGVIQSVGGDIALYPNSFIGGNPPLVLKNSTGNVGLGTSTPAHHLSVLGGPSWTSNLWAGAVELGNASAIGWQTNSGGQSFGFGQSTGGLYFFRTASNPGTTASPANYDLTITDLGNVGIGDTTPSSKLSVNGGMSVNGAMSVYGITNFGNFSFQTNASVGQTALCYTGGTLKTLATCSSSLRYKTDVQPYAGGMDVVNRLKPVTFIWKDGGAADIGFIAEDVAALEPLLVTYNDSGTIEGLKYERMGVLFANALQELQAQIQQQQNELDRLKPFTDEKTAAEVVSLQTQVQDLKDQNSALEARLTALEQTQSGQTPAASALLPNVALFGALLVVGGIVGHRVKFGGRP